MEQLLKDYISEIFLQSKPIVTFYNFGVNVIDFTYTHEYNSGDDIKEQVSIWHLLEFVYDKTKKQ